VTDNPIRVLRLIARLNIGGPARHVAILDEGLRVRGHDTLVVYGSLAAGEGSLERLLDDRALPSIYVPHLGRRVRPLDDLRAFISIFRAIRQRRPDVIHTHTAKAGALGRLAAALHNAITPGRHQAVVVHTFHGHVFSGYFGVAGSMLVRVAERALARLTDTIVAISPAQRADLTETFRIAPPARVQTVPLGLELTPLLRAPREGRGLRQALGLGPSAVVVGFVGRLVPVKDPATLVRAAALARREVADLHLIVAGDGALRASLHGLADDLGIAGSVHFLGWCSDLPSLYAAMDVFVLTSINEGTPVSLIEAMAAGVPAVATRVGGVPDVIRDGVDGMLVPAGDAPAVARAILDTISDRALAAQRARAARDRVAERYESARLVDDMEELYRELLRRKRGTHPRARFSGRREGPERRVDRRS
jgi:glycosyltransferase involved in cell wall biosynthesis